MISVSTHHDDVRSFAQIAISILIDVRGLLLIARTRSVTYKSVRGSQLMSLTISYTFYTHNTPIQISQGLPIDVPYLLLYFYMHITTYKQQGAPDRRSIQFLLLSVCASSRTKSKGLLIDASYNLYYFQHAQHRVQKTRDSRSMLHIASITFSTRIAAYKKQGAP
jgi:hypothetical protein